MHSEQLITAKLDSFKESWQFTRALTVDMLRSLSDKELAWSPGERVGVFWKQFRHVGRVQEDYTSALTTKTISFSCADKHYAGGADAGALEEYLGQLDEAMFEKLTCFDNFDSIDWFGEKVDVGEHLFRLASHETLHHGQWIVYCQLLGRDFPASWSVWGL